MKPFAFVLSTCLFFLSCDRKDNVLPILGSPKIEGENKIYPTIQAFKFINQEGVEVTEKTFNDKIYIADFIFLSCPTICPVMTNEMHEVYETYKSNPNVLFISHTVDPVNDSIPLLKRYAENLGAEATLWHFVTGNKNDIYRLAEESYFAVAYADSAAPGGFVHSGGLFLVDKNKHIRGVYDGTNPAESERLKSDLKKLLNEQF